MAQLQSFPADAFSEGGERFALYTEASDLRLPPGQFPRIFKIEGNIGNSQPFVFVRDEEKAVYYRQDCGVLTVCIFAD